jgi:hypothetical protein
MVLSQGQEEAEWVEAETIDSHDELERFGGAKKKEGLELKMDSAGAVTYWEVDMGMEAWYRLGFALVGTQEGEEHLQSNLVAPHLKVGVASERPA